jgi:hypothetical protein
MSEISLREYLVQYDEVSEIKKELSSTTHRQTTPGAFLFRFLRYLDSVLHIIERISVRFIACRPCERPMFRNGVVQRP